MFVNRPGNEANSRVYVTDTPQSDIRYNRFSIMPFLLQVVLKMVMNPNSR